MAIVKTRPKFTVGEEVLALSGPSGEWRRLEIATSGFYRSFRIIETGDRFSGWVYGFIQGSDIKYAPEQNLKKLPPEELISWEDCEWQPTDLKVGDPG